jgi:hypothetical protein
VALSLPIPSDQLANLGSSVTIEELEPTTPGGKPRRLILVGGALPLAGQADWAGESSLVTTWYPGNGVEASQQLLGSKLASSSWTGEWNRTRMGRAPSYLFDETGAQRSIVDPTELYLAIEDFREAGARLRVTWSVKGREILGTNLSSAEPTDRSVDFEIVREGRIKTFKINPDRATDVKWTIQFDWSSKGGRIDRVASVRRDEDLALASTAATRAIDALDFYVDTKIVSVKKGARLSAGRLTLGQLESLANAPLKAVNAAMAKLRYNVNQFKRAGDLARKLASTPFALANSVLDFARNTTAIANQFVDSFGRTPPELLATKQKVADLARATKYFGGIEQGMRGAASAASALDVRMREALVAGANRGALTVKESSTTRQGELIAIHVCKAGDTPQRVSQKYYRNPDQGEAILRANRRPLHTPTFRPGLILIIPALTNRPSPR